MSADYQSSVRALNGPPWPGLSVPTLVGRGRAEPRQPILVAEPGTADGRTGEGGKETRWGRERRDGQTVVGKRSGHWWDKVGNTGNMGKNHKSGGGGHGNQRGPSTGANHLRVCEPARKSKCHFHPITAPSIPPLQPPAPTVAQSHTHSHAHTHKNTLFSIRYSDSLHTVLMQRFLFCLSQQDRLYAALICFYAKSSPEITTKTKLPLGSFLITEAVEGGRHFQKRILVL